MCTESQKPEIFLTYNKTKGGVDAVDQMAHAFTTKMENGGGVTDVPQRKTKRQVQLAPNVLAIFAQKIP